MHYYANTLAAFYEKHRHPIQAESMSKYMRNHFDFFGIRHPDRRKLDRAFIKQHGLPELDDTEQVIESLFELPQRECHYFAMEIMKKMEKNWTENSLRSIEFMITNRSWWDTVDYLSSNLSGSFFKKFPALITEKTGNWNKSNNIWLQRSSILFQLKYKESTNTELLEKYILRHQHSKEFFIRKAIGWVLREYAKTNPTWVVQFCEKVELSNLSRKEALKHLKS
ncbi:MAG: DNA alkylation repair protein [Chitinophagaceae bacterium]|nr:MAG: DNA alkylation repair protein [Chitinophagaceae bacterium]